MSRLRLCDWPLARGSYGALRRFGDRLSDSLREIDRKDAEATARRLRSANATIWRMVNELEASHQEFLWNVGALIAAIEEAHDEDDLEMASIFVQLANDGVLKVAVKRLIAVAEHYGLDPTTT